MYMAIGVVKEVLLLGSVPVINWCFCEHYPNGKCGPHLKKKKFLPW